MKQAKQVVHCCRTSLFATFTILSSTLAQPSASWPACRNRSTPWSPASSTMPPMPGVEILKQGGNAVDAAVAVGFALAVVYPPAGNIGGGGFMLIRPSTSKLNAGKPTFLDYREKAPAAASRDMYLDAAGNVVPKLSTVGSKASGVPGTVAGLAYAEQHFGKLGLAKVMAPAIRLAREGFLMPEDEAHSWHNSLLAQFPEKAAASSSATATSTSPVSSSSSPTWRARSSASPPTPTTSTKAKWPPRSPRSRPQRRPHHRSRPRRLPVQGAHTARRPLSRARGADLAAAQLRRHRVDRSAQHPRRLRPASTLAPKGQAPAKACPAATARPSRSTSSPKPSAAPTWIAATSSATPTSTPCRWRRWLRPPTPPPGAKASCRSRRVRLQR